MALVADTKTNRLLKELSSALIVDRRATRSAPPARPRPTRGRSRGGNPKREPKPTPPLSASHHKSQLLTRGRKLRFIGVRVKSGNYIAEIKINAERKNLGFFETEEAAAQKYDTHAAKLGRPTNFPRPGTGAVFPNERGVSSPIESSSSSAETREKSSKFLGASLAYDGKGRKEARISVDGKQKQLGNFETVEESSNKHDAHASRLRRPTHSENEESVAPARKKSRTSAGIGQSENDGAPAKKKNDSEQNSIAHSLRMVRT